MVCALKADLTDGPLDGCRWRALGPRDLSMIVANTGPVLDQLPRNADVARGTQTRCKHVKTQGFRSQVGIFVCEPVKGGQAGV